MGGVGVRGGVFVSRRGRGKGRGVRVSGCVPNSMKIPFTNQARQVWTVLPIRTK